MVKAKPHRAAATRYSKDTDWVFASPQSLGKKPYWPDMLLKRQIKPAAERAGITKVIGWHTFRRTLATLLQSSGASVKTTQELIIACNDDWHVRASRHIRQASSTEQCSGPIRCEGWKEEKSGIKGVWPFMASRFSYWPQILSLSC